MAYDRHRGFVFRDPEGGLIAHVHMALFGFVATTIYGAGHRLIPWIALSQIRSRWEGRASFALTQAEFFALAGGFRLLVTAACYLGNLGLALSHVARPDGNWTLATSVK